MAVKSWMCLLGGRKFVSQLCQPNVLFHYYYHHSVRCPSYARTRLLHTIRSLTTPGSHGWRSHQHCSYRDLSERCACWYLIHPHVHTCYLGTVTSTESINWTKNESSWKHKWLEMFKHHDADLASLLPKVGSEQNS